MYLFAKQKHTPNKVESNYDSNILQNNSHLFFCKLIDEKYIYQHQKIPTWSDFENIVEDFSKIIFGAKLRQHLQSFVVSTKELELLHL